MNKHKKLIIVAFLIILTILISVMPLLFLPGAEFRGSDDAGSEMIAEVTGGDYKPWFKPVIETFIGGELPGEMETFFFCVQTGIGASVIAYCFGYLVARRKYGGDKADRGQSLEQG